MEGGFRGFFSQQMGMLDRLIHLPCSSRGRATNENMNGLIRQYFPKKRSFATITEQEIEFVMERLNNRPRKCLGFKSPNQVIFNHSSVVALRS
jgi:IS30 family transposase